jgi:hypothetical protein
MTPAIATLRIGRALTIAEDNVDTTLAGLSSLLGQLVEVRLATDTPAATGHRALARIAGAQAKMVEARADLIRAHADLRRLAEAADMPTECPSSAQAQAQTPGARAAA